MSQWFSKLIICAVALSTVFLLWPKQVEGSIPVVVVISKKSRIKKLSRREIRNLFLGRQTRIKGQRFYVINQARGSQIRKAFERKVLRMNSRKITDYWQRRILSGTGRPPVTFNSLSKVKRVLKTVPSAISYVKQGDFDDSFRVLGYY